MPIDPEQRPSLPERRRELAAIGFETQVAPNFLGSIEIGYAAFPGLNHIGKMVQYILITARESPGLQLQRRLHFLQDKGGQRRITATATAKSWGRTGSVPETSSSL